MIVYILVISIAILMFDWLTTFACYSYKLPACCIPANFRLTAYQSISSLLYASHFQACCISANFKLADRASRRNIARHNKTAFGPPWQVRFKFLSKLRIWGPIKLLVHFHRCLISCAAEYPDNIYFIQSSDKHNQLMQRCVTFLCCFIVNTIWPK